jgi:hypothetical protein
MSTTASSASPSVVRSHSTSSRPASSRPVSSDLPHRTRSVAVRPSTASQPSPQRQSQSHQHYHSKSQAYDRRPPSNHAVFDHIARRDGAQPAPARRSSSRERSQERPPTTHRSDSSAAKHQRNLSAQGHQRDSIDMATAGPVVAEGAAAVTQPPSASRLHPAAAMPSKRRTTITTPSGQWALGKTLGAGSMGKVKVGKNIETGEQVAPPWIPFHVNQTRMIMLTRLGGRENCPSAVDRGTPQLPRCRES